MEPLGTGMKGKSEGVRHDQVGFADFVTTVAQFWNDWGLRITVLGSLAAYAIIGLLSPTRRRSASSRWWSIALQWAAALILWAACQIVNQAATSALGSLSLCASDDASAEEDQPLVAFWAPFLLLHLGGPDNMAAYSLEDTKLSLRKVAMMVLQLLGVVYAIWNYIYLGPHSRRFLFPAAVIMCVVGTARYVEGALALHLANLDNMADDGNDSTEVATPLGCTCRTSTNCRNLLNRETAADVNNGQALYLAQALYPVWRRALYNSAVNPGSATQRSSEKLVFSQLGWRSMCKVAEMELSLMYEALYAKAAVAHTWPGYLLRFLSPIAAAAAAWLFWLYRDIDDQGPRQINKQGSSSSPLPSSFVVITYLLLGAAFAMDVVWLLRALGSTWTCHFLETNAKTWPWLRHKALCGGWWCQLHRFIVYLDPLRLLSLGTIDPLSYRRWSGTIGRYNLLRECTTAPRCPRWCRWLAVKAGLEEAGYLSELPECVKKLLFERVRRVLPVPARGDENDDDAYTMTAVTTLWGQEALRRAEGLFVGESKPMCGREFEQDVLTWHIATCIFLSRAKVRNLPNSLTGHVTAIEAVSEYLMFLVALRREMLPGLVLRKLFDDTRRALEKIWDDGKGATTTTSSRHTACSREGVNKEKLATMLRRNRNKQGEACHMLRRNRRNDDGEDLPPRSNGGGGGEALVLDAAEIAAALTKSSMCQGDVVKMLELVFNVWVDKLLYAAARCSRESHAKQLSHGGELTTVLWIVVHHAGPFRIGELKQPDQNNKSPPDGGEEGKKKQPGEKGKPPFPGEPATTMSSGPWHPDEPWIPIHPPPMYMDYPAVKTTDSVLAEDEHVDSEDAKDYEKPITYATLY